jgi:hypothetical protein
MKVFKDGKCLKIESRRKNALNQPTKWVPSRMIRRLPSTTATVLTDASAKAGLHGAQPW